MKILEESKLCRSPPTGANSISLIRKILGTKNHEYSHILSTRSPADLRFLSALDNMPQRHFSLLCSTSAPFSALFLCRRFIEPKRVSVRGAESLLFLQRGHRSTFRQPSAPINPRPAPTTFAAAKTSGRWRWRHQ